MANDGEVVVGTRIDPEGFKKGVKDLEAEAKKGIKGIGDTVSSHSSKWGSIASAGLRAAGTALAAVGTAMAAAATSGVKYNAQMEQYVTSFQTMLGSADEAQKMVNDLKSFAAETPLEMEGLAKNTQTLLAFGTASEDVIPTLRMLGDVALGDQQKMESLTLAFAQVSSTGKLTGQDLLQMINAGFNPLNEISKITGKSVEELKEEMADGAISAEMVAAAFEHATSEGGQFYGAMKAQSKTLSGQLSTLADNAKSLLGEITQGLTKSIQNEALPALNEYVSQIRSAFLDNGLEGVAEAFGDVLADAISRITRTLPQFVKTGTQVIKSFLSGIKENAGEIAGGVVDVVGELVSGMADMLPVLIDAGMSMAAGLVSGIAEALPKLLPDVISGAIDAVTSVIANLPGLLEAGVQLVAGLLEGVVQAIPEMMSSISIMLGTAFESIAKALGFNIDGVLTDNLKKTREMLDAHKDLMEQIESSAEAYKDSTDEIKANSAVLKAQKDELYRLVAEEEKTEGQKLRILSLVDQLNEAIPELNLAYDEQADALNRTAESVDAYIDAAMQRQELIALEEREIELYKESEAAAENLKAIEEQLAALMEGKQSIFQLMLPELIQYIELTNAQKEAEEAATEASSTHTSAQDALKAAYEEAATAADAATESTDGLSASMEVFEEKLEPVIIAGQDVSAALAAVGGDAEEAQRRFEELSVSATDAFEKMSEGTEISLQQMTENLQYNAERLAEYSDLVDTIMQRFGTEIPEGFREWLQQLGPEQANVLRQLANATPGEFQAFIDAWERGVMNAGEAAVSEQGVQGNALSDAVRNTVDEVSGIMDSTTAPQTAARTLVNDTANEAKAAVTTAGFESVGVNMVAGMIDGMNSMAGSLASTARSLARQAFNA